MDGASLGLAVFSAFKDAYLTAKFIRNTAHSMKNFRGEQSSLVAHLNVQIIRLKNFSRLFRGVNGNDVDMSLLEAVPEQYLNTVCAVLGELQRVLGEYAKLAASLDEDYKRYSPASPYFSLDTSNPVLQIEDEPAVNVKPQGTDTDIPGPDGSLTSKKDKRWSFFGVGSSSSKTKDSSFRARFSMSKLPPGVQWLFTKDKLEETLKRFKEWNDELQYLIGPLLSGFGFYEHRNLLARLQPDGQTNIFQGHIELNSLADNQSRGTTTDDSSDNLIPWSEAQSRISAPRILVEYKQIGSEHETGDANLNVPIKELYAPQLARFLKTAGRHHFQTLPFKAYAWNPQQIQYAFLFDYPPETGTCPPKSLHNFITSSEKEPKFKLELKQRFHVAQTLARAIGAFHSDGWLHKSIRAHALKFFFTVDDLCCDFGNPYLTDFEFSRPEGGITRLAARAVDTDHDVYRHPDRYGLPTASFRKVHDIYSLGVVLLEIGLWQTARQMYDDIVEYDLKGNVPPGGVPAKLIKEAFMQDAKDRLAHRMGSQYQEAVLSCLDGDWDELVGGSLFESEFQKGVVEKVGIKAFTG